LHQPLCRWLHFELGSEKTKELLYPCRIELGSSYRVKVTVLVVHTRALIKKGKWKRVIKQGKRKVETDAKEETFCKDMLDWRRNVR
jgi:hypothetical protein